MSLLTAKTSFACMRDGHQFVVNQGDLYDSDDEVVKAHPDQFEIPMSMADRRAAVIEDASAVPGEKRSTRRRNG